MIAPGLVRVLRVLGWLTLTLTLGVFACVMGLEIIRGPAAGASIWPTPRLWGCYQTTLLVSLGAVAISFVIALPIAAGLIQAHRPWRRRTLLALTIAPLLIMPNVFSYAWILLATSKVPAIRSVMDALGWNAPGSAAWQTAWVHGFWLWPIPALLLSTTYRQIGRPSFQLARLDASPIRAAARAALPAMRGPVLVAALAVFILSSVDSSVPGLMNATRTWAYETMASARNLPIAGVDTRPVGSLLWSQWPMLATLAVLIGAVAVGLRPMIDRAGEPTASNVGASPRGPRWLWPAATALAACVVMLPAGVFALEFATGREPILAIADRAIASLGGAAAGTLAMAALAAIGAMLIGLVTIDPHVGARPRKRYAALAIAFLIAAAVPPELIATAFIEIASTVGRLAGDAGADSSAIARLAGYVSHPGGWNLYDDTPLFWTAALLVRFGFVAAGTAYVAALGIGRDLVGQAAVDGAGPAARIATVGLPPLVRPLAAAGLIVGCLSLSEAACSVLLQPTRFLGGALSVKIDAQMHYGREELIIAASGLLMLPALCAAIIIPILVDLSQRRRPHADDSTSA